MSESSFNSAVCLQFFKDARHGISRFSIDNLAGQLVLAENPVSRSFVAKARPAHQGRRGSKIKRSEIDQRVGVGLIENARSFVSVNADVTCHSDPIFFGDLKIAAMMVLMGSCDG